MVCIYCQGKTSVINSRPQKRTNSTWRRRKCLDCNAITTSVEMTDLASALMVVSESSPPQPFSRDILLLSVYDSLRHRKSAIQDAQALTDTIISLTLASTTNPRLEIAKIKEATLATLAKFDEAAAVHYLAFHRLD